MRKLALQILAVVVATYVVSMLVAWWSLPTLEAPRIDEAKFRATNAKLDIFFRNPDPTLRECGLMLPQGTGVITATHARLVRTARCLELKGLISARERRTIERDKSLGLSSAGLLTVEYLGWAWQTLAVWLVGMALIVFLLYRHWKPQAAEESLRAKPGRHLTLDQMVAIG
jgi:hypothetical protein